MKKKLVLALVSLSLLLSACTKTFGGHSVTVTMPHNDCSSSFCLTETETEIISVK